MQQPARQRTCLQGPTQILLGKQPEAFLPTLGSRSLGSSLRKCDQQRRPPGRPATPPAASPLRSAPWWASLARRPCARSRPLALPRARPPPAWSAGNPGSSRAASSGHSLLLLQKRKESPTRAERSARLEWKGEEARGSGLFSHLVIRKRDFSSARSPHFWTALLLPRAQLWSHLTSTPSPRGRRGEARSEGGGQGCASVLRGT